MVKKCRALSNLQDTKNQATDRVLSPIHRVLGFVLRGPARPSPPFGGALLGDPRQH